MNSKSELRGVGGWLSLLIVLMCFVGPIQALGGTAIEFSNAESQNQSLSTLQQWGNYKNQIWLLMAFISSMLFFGGWRLWNTHKPSSVFIAATSLWLAYLLGISGQYLIVITTMGQEIAGVADLGGEVAISIVKGAVSPIIWTAYLLISRRIRNTYFIGNSTVTSRQERADPEFKLKIDPANESVSPQTSLHKYDLLQKLKTLLDSGVINQSEYEIEKSKILNHRN